MDEEKQIFQAEATLLELSEMKVRPTGATQAQKSYSQARANGRTSQAEVKPQYAITREMILRLIDWIKEV